MLCDRHDHLITHTDAVCTCPKGDVVFSTYTREQAVKDLEFFHVRGDSEKAHYEADQILCHFLIGLGYNDIVDAWLKIQPKWYS
jgi:hypothetical protein